MSAILLYGSEDAVFDPHHTKIYQKHQQSMNSALSDKNTIFKNTQNFHAATNFRKNTQNFRC